MATAEIFLSLRFAEALDAAKLVKNALEHEGFSVFLCSVNEGESIAEEVARNLVQCKLAVVFGTSTYGMKTQSSYSTFKEMSFIMEEKKPFFLMKMCDRFDEPMARFYFDSTVAYYPWFEDNSVLPSDLVSRISQKFFSINGTTNEASKGDMVLKSKTQAHYDAEYEHFKAEIKELEAEIKELEAGWKKPEAERIGEHKNEYLATYGYPASTQQRFLQLQEAKKMQNHQKIIEILTNIADDDIIYVTDYAEVISACRTIWEMARETRDDRRRFGSCGACEAVVQTLRTFGGRSKETVEQGCYAVSALAQDSDNCGKLGKCGACEAVMHVLRIWNNNPDVASSACSAILGLAHDSRNRSELLKLGAVSAIRGSAAENQFSTIQSLRISVLCGIPCLLA